MTLPLEQELELLDYDIERLQRRLASTERAPHEHRWAGGKTEHLDTCANLRQRIVVLVEERDRLRQIMEDDGA